MNEYRHGGEIYNKEVHLDFSVNINPFGLPEGVKKALIGQIDSFNLYPDNECLTLREALAEAVMIPKEYIMCGNGASDLIFRICFALKPMNAVLLSPTFSEYEKALLGIGSSIHYYNLKEENNFQLTEDILEFLDETIDIFFLCNPNNPVGNRFNPELLDSILKVCKKNNILFVVDECFLDFTEGEEEQSLLKYIKDYDNLFIIRAFTKFFAMAGLRLGYGFCSNIKFLEEMELSGPSWNVSVPAQIAGIAALNETAYSKKTMELIKEERQYLFESLRSLNLRVFEPTANYLLFQAKETLYDEMLEKGILIRHCDNYRQLDKTYYRIAVKDHKENEQLITAMKECIDF